MEPWNLKVSRFATDVSLIFNLLAPVTRDPTLEIVVLTLATSPAIIWKRVSKSRWLLIILLFFLLFLFCKILPLLNFVLNPALFSTRAVITAFASAVLLWSFKRKPDFLEFFVLLLAWGLSFFRTEFYLNRV
jgi:hypothetical protein